MSNNEGTGKSGEKQGRFRPSHASIRPHPGSLAAWCISHAISKGRRKADGERGGQDRRAKRGHASIQPEAGSVDSFYI